MEATKQPRTFFWYFKPIALICKALGVFPLQKILSSDDPKNLTSKMFSLAKLYSVTVFACNVYMIQNFCGFVFSYKKSFYLFVVVYVIIGRSCLCFIFCSVHSKKLPELLRLLDTFDRKKNSILIDKNTDSTIRYFILWTIFPLIVGILAFGILFQLSVQVVIEIVPPELSKVQAKIAAYFFGFLNTWQLFPLLLFTYFALKIRSNYNIINDTLTKRGMTGCFFEDNVKYPEDMDAALEYLRQMHNLTTETVHVLSKSYGNFLAIDQLCIIIMVVVNICTFINERSQEEQLLALTLFNGAVVLALLLTSHAVKEAGYATIELLQGIVFSRVSDKCRKEIQMLMIQVGTNPPKISAAGFFTIDRRQIPAVMSSIATYLVASLQFLNDTTNEIPLVNITHRAV